MSSEIHEVVDSLELNAAFSLSGITSGTMLGLFTLGMFFPRANSRGALVGAVVSLVLVSCLVGGTQSAIASGALRHEALPVSVAECVGNFTAPAEIAHDNNLVWPVFRVSYMYYSLIGTLLVVLVGLPASCWLGDKSDAERHRDLFCPLVHRFLRAPPVTAVYEVKPLMLVNK